MEDGPSRAVDVVFGLHGPASPWPQSARRVNDRVKGVPLIANKLKRLRCKGKDQVSIPRQRINKSLYEILLHFHKNR